jgi:hypothetical protein
VAESDFEALDIRLGDRRKLQREIARRQLWPENSPLPTSDELREYKLSLEDDAAEMSKNGYFHHQVSEALESEGTSPEPAGTPALAASPLPSSSCPPISHQILLIDNRIHPKLLKTRGQEV